MTASTVIKCLTLLFSVFGMPAFIHSDRGPSLVCQELQEFLTGKGVAMSHTTAYNPAGNGQVEKYNGTVWKAVTMACKSQSSIGWRSFLTCFIPYGHSSVLLPMRRLMSASSVLPDDQRLEALSPLGWRLLDLCSSSVMSASARWNPWLMKWSSLGQTRTMPTSVTLMVEQHRCPPST